METKETEFIYSERTSNQQRFDKRLIQHVVYLAEQGVPRRDLLSQYGMSKNTLDNWMSKWATTIKKRKDYSLSEKRSVVRAVESGMSISQARIAFGTSDRSIRTWLKQFKEENAELGLSNPLQVAKKITDRPEKTELEALQRALEEEILKNRALNTMIDIAEQQLKIDIRKKSGAKQSPK
jgi:transposase